MQQNTTTAPEPQSNKDTPACGCCACTCPCHTAAVAAAETNWKWPKRLVIVRHGQSAQNAALDLNQDDLVALAQSKIRDADIELTALGHWQAQQAGRFLAAAPEEERFDVCFVSPYKRAIETAERIVAELPYSVRIHKDNRLREKEFGRLHGLNPGIIKEKHPLEYETRMRDGKYWYRFLGGENYPDVEMRVHAFLDKLHRGYAGRTILVVTHQVPYKLFRAIFEHLDEQAVLALPDVHNCGLQEFRIDFTESPAGRMKLAYFNKRPYSPADAPIEVRTRTSASNRPANQVPEPDTDDDTPGMAGTA